MNSQQRSPKPECNLTPAPDTVNIADSEAAFEVIHDTLLNLWDTVNKLSSIRPPKRERYRVTIFGSARIQPGTSMYNGVRYLAEQLTIMGCDIITGGGPGLMQAANEGSVIADPENLTQSIGIRIDLGFEQQANPFVEEVYLHKTFFSRLHHFVIASDAFVVLPGGIGTALETFMIWQLLQVRKLHATPFITVGEMWKELAVWAQKYTVEVDPPMADPADMRIPNCVDTYEEAIALLREAHTQWKYCQDEGLGVRDEG
ncbi:putative Rossmann fold nucleotide-binding protein [Xenococcus sp. PCC 7305]|uniref:LOG family protein n=1 Tax=Xenococcus sp. PCC 7305 TaxID=102125 RepID=UPI0002ACC789|nr:LOG family protein [Xenococcus sp. PCC 7305]ELS04900.1 putative Rossmann fold nucleotide-binding protein [Xenococcus sp. PCC 7305]